ncbi:MAG: hypothetical protein E6Q59_03060 [Nitrosomonas sp.]|nr:hypothetical protein [Nitrosomonas sp.]TXI40795.1 MAG: hypothetical protein E6Q59_03060 [Nitrosomonas sp.]
MNNYSLRVCAKLPKMLLNLLGKSDSTDSATTVANTFVFFADFSGGTFCGAARLKNIIMDICSDALDK